MIKNEFTKEERHEIYILAFDIFKNWYSDFGMCYCILRSVIELHPTTGRKFDNQLTYTPMIKMLPEFLAIKPSNSKPNHHWWVLGNLKLETFIRKCMFETIIERTKTIKTN